MLLRDFTPPALQLCFSFKVWEWKLYVFLLTHTEYCWPWGSSNDSHISLSGMLTTNFCGGIWKINSCALPLVTYRLSSQSVEKSFMHKLLLFVMLHLRGKGFRRRMMFNMEPVPCGLCFHETTWRRTTAYDKKEQLTLWIKPTNWRLVLVKVTSLESMRCLRNVLRAWCRYSRRGWCG